LLELAGRRLRVHASRKFRSHTLLSLIPKHRSRRRYVLASYVTSKDIVSTLSIDTMPMPCGRRVLQVNRSCACQRGLLRSNVVAPRSGARHQLAWVQTAERLAPEPSFATVLPETHRLDGEREGRKACAPKRARLRSRSCRKPAAGDASSNDRVPHVVRSPSLREGGQRMGHTALATRGAMSRIPGAGRTFATKHSDSEKRPPMAPKFLPQDRLRPAMSLPASRSCWRRGSSACAGFVVSNA